MHNRPLTLPGVMRSCGTRRLENGSTCHKLLCAGGASQEGLPANLSETGASIPVDSPSIADITPSKRHSRSNSLPLDYYIIVIC